MIQKEIKSRIDQAKIGFSLKQKLLLSLSISIENRRMLLRTYVWNIAMYGSETWVIVAAERRRKVFEML